MILFGDDYAGGMYTRADLEFLYSLANLANKSIENAHLFKDALEKQRIEDNWTSHGEFSKDYYRRTPTIPGFDIAALTIPSKEVGGDLLR